MRKRSEFGKISGIDFLNAIYHGVAACTIPFLIYMLKYNFSNFTSNWYVYLSVFLSAFIGDIFKRSVTNSNGDILKREWDEREHKAEYSRKQV